MTPKSRLLMCPPQHFSVEYSINPWMDPSRPVSARQAHAQWHNLEAELARYVEVVAVDPKAGCPDMCFIANAGFVHGSTFVPSRFRHPERQAEEVGYRRWFHAAGYRCVDIDDDLFFEGAGDALFDVTRNVVWMGSGPRTDAAAAYELSVLTNLDVCALELIDPRFYHLDTCFCPLSTGDILYFPPAFSARALSLIEARVAPGKRIAVSEEDALELACNVVDVGHTIIVNHVSLGLRSHLAGRGIATRLAPVGEFLKAGGGVKCLCLPLPQAAGVRRALPRQRSADLRVPERTVRL